MKKNALIIGAGIQGIKRLESVKKYFNFVGYVDPISTLSKYRSLKEVPIKLYDAAFVCSPDSTKKKILQYLIKNKKHSLVEKPLNLKKKEYEILEFEANKNKIYLYTAYNHRFEQNIVNLKKLLEKKIIGKIYTVQIFYGNGTSKLVKVSKWKDNKTGVVSDLGSHLIDMIDFLFEKKNIKFKAIVKNKYENNSYDHATAYTKKKSKKNFNILIEMTYLSWKNTFKLNCIGKKGSLHIDGLCKWGPSYLTLRKRKLPSGYPSEKIKKIISKDMTWDLETKFFSDQIKKKTKTSLEKDKYIHDKIKEILQ